MKKETLIKVLDDEFGDSQPFSWLIDVVLRAVTKNDLRLTETTIHYDQQVQKVYEYLEELRDELKVMEKEESQSIRVTHKRKVNNKPVEE